MRTSATPGRSPRCSGHSAPRRPGTAAWTARRSGSCRARRTRRSIRLTAQVDRLLGEGWEPGQIALLVTGTRHQLQKEMLDYHGWDGYWDAFFAGDEVFYGHVLGFKGLERPVVVLAVNGLRDESRGREYLYVGLSRARSCLVVCGDLDQIAAVGGAGLRRRLQASMERPVLYRAGEGSGRPEGDRAAWTIRGRSVSAMVMTNRDRVDRGMGYLASGLGPFVNERMAAAFPDGEDWVQRLAARNPSRYGAGYRYSLSDPRFLLRVITEEWRVFKDSLSRVEQGFATELRDAGNRWAHGEQFSAEDTYRTLDTMERLLAAVGAAEQAGQVRGLRLDLAAAGGRGQRRPPLTLTRRGHSGRRQGDRGTRQGSGLAVGHADVVRAIEEYDRLGQDRFLAEHGFGRATAYLLIYRGRSYDSKAILGVAYKFATGVRIGPHEFSGGVSGAAGVLRRLGFEVRDMRDRSRPAGRRPRRSRHPGQAPCSWPAPPAAPRSGTCGVAGRDRPGAVAAGADLLCPQGDRRAAARPGRGRRMAAGSAGRAPPGARHRKRRHGARAARLAPLHRHLLPARPARAGRRGRRGPCRDHQRRVRHRPRRGTDRLVRQGPPAHRLAARTCWNRP